MYKETTNPFFRPSSKENILMPTVVQYMHKGLLLTQKLPIIYSVIVIFIAIPLAEVLVR